MAEFCLQCNEEMFGPEVTNDAKGLIADDDSSQCIPFLCEGCGILHTEMIDSNSMFARTTFVDREGRCVWPSCPTHGHLRLIKGVA